MARLAPRRAARARSREMVPPHLSNEVIDLGRVPREGNLVGDVIRRAAGKSSPVPGNVVPVHSTSNCRGRPTGFGKVGALSKMSCANADFWGEQELLDCL